MKSRSKQQLKKQKRYKSHQQQAKTKLTTNGNGLTLSLCLIAKDEAKNIANCIKSIKSLVDEIIVVDTGSTDATKGIAQELGAKVYDFPWINDFSAARNESIKHASGDYIIWMDADDVISEAELLRLKALKTHFPKEKNQAYFMLVKSQDTSVGSTDFHQMRIFPNVLAARFEYPIHEQVSHNLEKAEIELLRTDIAVSHIGNIDHDDLLRKSRRNLALVEEELKKNPDNVIMHFHAARSFSNMNQLEDAVRHMQQVMDNQTIRSEKGPVYMEAGLLMGRYYNEMGLFSSAESVLKEIEPFFKEATLIQFEIGKSYFLAERYEEAIEVYTVLKGIEIKAGFMPVNKDWLNFQQHFFLGKAYEETNQYEKAIAEYETSTNYKAMDYRGYNSLAVMSLKKGSYEDALNYMEKAIEHAPDEDCVMYANLGLAYRKMKQYPKAEKALMRAIEINPDRMEAFVNLGYLYMEMSTYNKAQSAFTRALRLDPEMMDVHLALCECYFRIQNIDKLVSTCNEVLVHQQIAINQTLESLQDLSTVFEQIGDSFFAEGKNEIALIAYQVGFLIYPLASVLHKLLPVASTSMRQKQIVEVVEETLKRYAGDKAVIASVQSVLDQFQNTAQYTYQ